MRSRQECAARPSTRSRRKLETLQASLPPGVEIVPTYDRSALIERAVDNLGRQADRGVHRRRAGVRRCSCSTCARRFVAIVSLPLGVLAAFIVMHYQGVNANIMSLGGIAIAIGAMVDAAVVMIENAHKHLERWHARAPRARRCDGDDALARDRRRGGRGRAGAVLLAADHHAVVHPGVHAARRRKGGCSRRWPSPRPTRWRPRPGWRSR